MEVSDKPRYIDAEALTDYMLERYNDLCEKHGDYDHYTTGYGDAIDVIEVAPTADVVPKSEVDDLTRYIILNEDIAIKCKQANGEENEEYWKGKVSAFRQIRAYIDTELKNKYTEEKT